MLRTDASERLEINARGQGSRLSAALAAGLAQGLEPAAAMAQAHRWVQAALAAAFRPGMGRAILQHPAGAGGGRA